MTLLSADMAGLDRRGEGNEVTQTYAKKLYESKEWRNPHLFVFPQKAGDVIAKVCRFRSQRRRG